MLRYRLLPGWVRKARRQWHARTAGELAPGLAAVTAFFAQKQQQQQQQQTTIEVAS